MPMQTKIEGVAFSPPTGGQVIIPPSGDVTIPGPIRQLSTGVAFGPLAVRPETTQPVSITRLSFPQWHKSQEADASGHGKASAFATGSIAAGFLADEDGSPRDTLTKVSSQVGRRGFLAGTSLILGGALLRADVLSDSEQSRTHIELDLSENPGGVTLSLVEAMTAGGNVVSSHDVRLDGTRIDRLTIGSDEDVLVPPGRTGHVTIQTSGIGGDN